MNCFFTPFIKKRKINFIRLDLPLHIASVKTCSDPGSWKQDVQARLRNCMLNQLEVPPFHLRLKFVHIKSDFRLSKEQTFQISSTQEEK